MKRDGKTRLISARIREHEKLEKMRLWFNGRYEKVFGRKPKRACQPRLFWTSG